MNIVKVYGGIRGNDRYNYLLHWLRIVSWVSLILFSELSNLPHRRGLPQCQIFVKEKTKNWTQESLVGRLGVITSRCNPHEESAFFCVKADMSDNQDRKRKGFQLS